MNVSNGYNRLIPPQRTLEAVQRGQLINEQEAYGLHIQTQFYSEYV